MNEKIIEQYMQEVWNKKNLAPVDQVFSDTAIIHSPLGTFKSPAEMKETVSQWLLALPDLEVTLLNTIEENAIVVSH